MMITIIEIMVWIIGITTITVFGSWYARKYNKPDALIAIYVAFIIFCSLTATKIAKFDLGFFSLFAPAAVIIFSVTFLMTDIVNEKFGRKEAHKMVFITFITQVAISFFSWIILSLTPAPFWANQNAFESIFGQVPRIIIAGWIAFLVSENIDVYIFAKLKEFTKGKHLWSRNVFSSLPSMAIESILFITVAFYGLQPVIPIIFGATIMKWFVGLINIPFIYLNRMIIYKE